jgi:uncharacterized sodium:solute symporter family permease YidK
VGFFAAVMMGAILSSFNSALNSTCTLFSLGLYKSLINKEANNGQVVKSGKIFGWIIAVFSLTLAPLLIGQDSIFGYLQKMNGIVFAYLVILMLVVGELKPLRDEWVQEDVKAVDMAPWKHARAISAVLVLIVLTIYVVFADLSVLS